jgi:hypothetical protein
MPCLEWVAMRRWLLLFLLFVVPLQAVWASAAPYCSHESGMTANKHFGHHDHSHEGDGQTSRLSYDDADLSGAYHADCGACHLGAFVSLAFAPFAFAVAPAGALPTAPTPRYLSHIAAGPERPDRAVSAAAVRFGGGVGFDPSS